MEYTCPVCGYDKLEDFPSHHEICPSCGTQFGYHDVTRTHADLRARWLANPHWHSRVDKPPRYWNPYTQLANLSKSATQNVAITVVEIGKKRRIVSNSLAKKTVFGHLPPIVNSGGTGVGARLGS